MLVYAKPGANALRLSRLPLDVVESGNSPVTVEITSIRPKSRKTKKHAANGDTEAPKSKKRQGTETPTVDPVLSKKARMYSPDQEMPPPVQSKSTNGGYISDDSAPDGGDEADDDLAFYENLEQVILEQRDDDEDENEDGSHGGANQSDSEGYSSDGVVGWQSRI
jgi:hypothetical protein